MTKEVSTLGTIERGKVYPLALFMSLTGLGTGAIRKARRRGLHVKYTASRAFISGDAWIDFLERVEDDRAVPTSAAK